MISLLVCGDVSSFRFLILGFFKNHDCVSPVQVTLESLIHKIKKFVKFMLKC
jgi:hypothetical protein